MNNFIKFSTKISYINLCIVCVVFLVLSILDILSYVDLGLNYNTALWSIIFLITVSVLYYGISFVHKSVMKDN